MKLGILATHPIQYFAPLYRELAARPGLDTTVFFAHRPTPVEQGAGFGVAFEWDLDLTSGYRHVFLRNRARAPGVTSFRGCDTPSIRDEIARGRFDAFLVSGWASRSYWQAMSASWRTGTPCMVRGDSQIPATTRRTVRVAKRLLYPAFMRRFAACLAVGTRSEAFFRQHGARLVVRSPHFVDNQSFAASASSARPQRTQLRAGWGLSADADVLLFAGKLVPKKRPFDLLHAVARMSPPRPEILVVGDGELRQACETLATELDVRARFAGFLNQSEIARAYAAADALVLPSDGRETWGLVVNEAMACGLPAVVCEQAGCAPDLVVEGVTGFTFPLADIDALANRIARITQHGSDRIDMGASARRHVQAFSVSAAADGILEAAGMVRARRAA